MSPWVVKKTSSRRCRLSKEGGQGVRGVDCRNKDPRLESTQLLLPGKAPGPGDGEGREKEAVQSWGAVPATARVLMSLPQTEE